MKICNIIVANFILVILVLWVAFCVFYPSQIPTFTFTAITAGFAYQAYRYTKEKFRLELFEKRWEFYESIMLFNSRMATVAPLGRRRSDFNNDEEYQNWKKDAKETHKLAHQAFRGMGWHKSQLLFGKDICGGELYKILNNAYCKSSSGQTIADELFDVFETTKDLPQTFSPYLYFGDYKYDAAEEKNLCELCASAVNKITSFNSRKDETNVSTS